MRNEIVVLAKFDDSQISKEVDSLFCNRNKAGKLYCRRIASKSFLGNAFIFVEVKDMTINFDLFPKRLQIALLVVVFKTILLFRYMNKKHDL